MVALYVTSTKRGSGKTTLCAGLGKHLLSSGKKVSFFKPITTDNKNRPMGSTDSDATFIKHLFALEESVGLLCPVFTDESNLTDRIREAYARVSPGKDVVIVEGVSEQYQAARNIVAALNARVIVVESYSKELLKAINSYQDFGKSLLGVVLNKVPKSRIEPARREASAQLAQAGINMLGVLPEDRTLLALTIGELVERIQGEILNGAEKLAELVENIMLGAKSVDPGPDYFSRKSNKVVVVRSERPDMQLATLETSTTCLILAGNTAPMSVVLDRAKERKVPIILTKNDITTVVTNIEDTLGKTKFSQENKLPKLSEIMEQHFDFQTVYQGLGLAG